MCRGIHSQSSLVKSSPHPYGVKRTTKLAARPYTVSCNSIYNFTSDGVHQCEYISFQSAKSLWDETHLFNSHFAKHLEKRPALGESSTHFQRKFVDFAFRRSKKYVSLQFIPEQLVFVLSEFHLSQGTVQGRIDISRLLYILSIILETYSRAFTCHSDF